MTDAQTQIADATADELFEQHAATFGGDLNPYSHHVHRVIGLIGLQVDIEPELARPLGVAAFYHDAAIWFDNTWDYLPGSIERALDQLDSDDEELQALVTAMIDEHHRMRHAHHPHPLVEAFRRADMTDVYSPIVGAPNVARSEYRDLVREYPYDGFRRMLAKAFGRGLREHPLSPMPMVKL
jgi:hypothetical protein